MLCDFGPLGSLCQSGSELEFKIEFYMRIVKASAGGVRVSQCTFSNLFCKKCYDPEHIAHMSRNMRFFNNVVCATSKVSDQPAHTRSLIRAFASRLNIL